MPADYYALLGVGSDASEEQIKRAYRKRARELHPDSTGGDPHSEEKFKEVTMAYEVLRDPERRRRYDMFGPEGVSGQHGGGSMGGLGDQFFSGSFSDLFDSFFGVSGMSGSSTRSRRGGPERGQDVETVLNITFEEAAFGTDKSLSVETLVACEDCSASGAQLGTSASRCPECGGSGELRRVRQSILGQIVTAAPCNRCSGTGEVIASKCSTCRGEGRVVKKVDMSVSVPAGVSDGTTLRLTGKGPVGRRGGPRGDLYVHLAVSSDARFEREGADLYAELHISVPHAVLGATVPFETLDGEELVEIPRGTQSGYVIKFRGKGVRNLNGRGRGDLYVKVAVDIPDSLSPAQEELYRQLAKEEGAGVEAQPHRSRLRSLLS
ncbi:MAG: molecular chaperone DnaJ [Actinobacteria bacterium]|nr:molecular chaperone DnaJ [Actinomycetota bacterium]MCL5446039.1 molecular chaperone DnaJ [Actinomycetota bacterium]